MERNRAQGWQHAKLSGHAFEREYARLVGGGGDNETRRRLMDLAKRRGIRGEPVSCDPSGGTKKVPDFSDGKTVSKQDARVVFSSGVRLAVSLKKPSTGGGQALLTRLDRFVDAIRWHSGEDAPRDAVWVLSAFLGETEGVSIRKFAPGVSLTSPLIRKHGVQAEIYQNRLYASTLETECTHRWQVFKAWIEEVLPLVTRVVFRYGFCSNEEDFADVLYYGCSGEYFDLEELADRTRGFEVAPSKRGYYRGSTITMPWGFLQGHRPGRRSGPYQLQFHHDVVAIRQLLLATA